MEQFWATVWSTRRHSMYPDRIGTSAMMRCAGMRTAWWDGQRLDQKRLPFHLAWWTTRQGPAREETLPAMVVFVHIPKICLHDTLRILMTRVDKFQVRITTLRVTDTLTNTKIWLVPKDVNFGTCSIRYSQFYVSFKRRTAPYSEH